MHAASQQSHACHVLASRGLPVPAEASLFLQAVTYSPLTLWSKSYKPPLGHTSWLPEQLSGSRQQRCDSSRCRADRQARTELVRAPINSHVPHLAVGPALLALSLQGRHCTTCSSVC